MKGLAEFEIAQILNLCPENLEEAEALIPSLRLADRRAPRGPRVGRAASPCGLSSDRFTQIGVERERGRARQHGPAQRCALEDRGVPRHLVRRPTSHLLAHPLYDQTPTRPPGRAAACGGFIFGFLAVLFSDSASTARDRRVSRRGASTCSRLGETLGDEHVHATLRRGRGAGVTVVSAGLTQLWPA